MRVGILGALEVTIGDEHVHVGGVRLRAFLVRLALDAGRVVTVDSLADAVWGPDQPADPVNAMHTLVSRLRRALTGAAEPRWAQDGYRLGIDADAVDALRFERLALEGRRALRRQHAGDAVARLREALELWRGDPLAGAAPTPYLEAAAGRLQELRLGAIEDRAEAELLGGVGGFDLVAELGELAAAHPLRERLRALHIRALHAAGRRAEALAAYEDFRAYLADELGADPGPGLQELHLSTLRGTPEPSAAGGPAVGPPGVPPGGPPDPPQPRPAAPRGNVRTMLTSFIGREDELRQVDEGLRQGRLVTLVGPGGAGKTRIATTYAAGAAGDHPGGAWLVELAPLTDAADVPRAVIGVLGLREGVLEGSDRPRDELRRLAEVLSATGALLVLDNCEHLLEGVARMVDDLLGHCPGLRVLATSRELLGIDGERLCSVLPLATPLPGDPPEVISASPSIRLLLDRVASHRPGLSFGPAELPVVAEICRRLDGLPLAIELAAARLRTLPAGELATRLDERFRLLTGGSRTALPRHQTLRAVVDWSWELLDEAERRFLQRLAVFPGTIVPEGAERVGEPPGHVLEALALLVDRSLLQVVEGPEARYRMLETIREYGLERLAEEGELTGTRAAHARYVLESAESSVPRLRGPEQPRLLRLLSDRHDDQMAALHEFGETGDAAGAVRLAAALGLPWTMRGDHAEAARRLRRALSVPGPAPDTAWATATAFWLFNLTMSEGPGHPDAVTGELRERIRRGLDERANEAFVLAGMALALIDNDLEAARTVAAGGPPPADPWTRAMIRLTGAFLHANDGDMEAMSREMAAAVEDFRQAEERWGLATALTFVGGSRQALGDDRGAVAALEESVRLMRELGLGDAAFQQVIWLAEARSRLGDLQRMRSELLEAVASDRPRPAHAAALFRISLAKLALDAGDVEDARRQLAEADRGLRSASAQEPLTLAMLESVRGRLLIVTGNLAAAGRHLAVALDAAADAPDVPLVAALGVSAAQLRHRQGDAKGAAELLGACRALHGLSGDHDPDTAALAGELRAELGAEAFELAREHGAALERDGALALLRRSCGTPEQDRPANPG
ncbi:BTAD domain-containing putative transcriptional regulator [Actinomadura sp. WMMB 499]|uniref:BTAD domain-containing putative transcriptional regulator n=1 Tax=Actinomadura sp. WMMB 499 TaxID=1219491 RepID=UPI0012476F09|nr:BTAD domain-containing putative transcriptional regulator [Actinomadura sp. WMMB 499]QFG24796.1 AfsR/SARP family transcriptional regulator [Actinomadura sp. WMMB 499]